MQPKHRFAIAALLTVLLIGGGVAAVRRAPSTDASNDIVITTPAGAATTPTVAANPSSAPVPAPPAPQPLPAATLPAATSPVAPSPSATPAATPPTPVPDPNVIIVHVAGAVKKPNVYKLHLGARVYQAIDAAGGAKDNASLDSLNLAEKLTDGVKVYVPTRGETVPFAPSVGLVGTKSVPSSVANAKPSGRSEGAASDKLTDPKQGVVFLHSATLEQLERLPGVGPAIAQRILDYRHQVGGFKSIDDLQNVSGIGDKKFAKLRPFVRL